MLIYAVNLVAAPGKSGRLAPLVAELRDVLTSDSGQRWTAWGVAAGAPFGTYVVSASFDSLAAMAASQMQSIGSERFAAVAEKYGDLLAGPSETSLTESIATTGELGAEAKPLMLVTRATMAGGHIRRAIDWSIRIMQHVTDVTGVAGLVGTSMTGGLFEIGWLSGYDTASDIDDSNAKLAADPGYLEMIDEAGELFVNGGADRRIIARMP